jgi:PAS domain S-box-containing protein
VNPVSIPLIALAGISFYAGVYHLVIYLRRKHGRENLSFSLFCISITFYQVTCIGLYNAADFTIGLLWQKSQWIAAMFFSTAMIWFIYDYINKKHNNLLYVLSAINFILALIQMIDRSELTFISGSHDPKLAPLLLGDQIISREVASGPVTIIQSFYGIFIVVFVTFIAISYCIKTTNKKRAIMLLVSMVIMNATMINDILVSNSIYHFLYLLEYGFLAYIVLMGYTLSDTVVKAAKTQDALRDSEERFRSLVETISDWVWETDVNGVFTYSSPKVKELLGYSPEEVVGKSIFAFMAKEEAKRIQNEIKNIVKNLQPFLRLELITMHKDGRNVVLETSGVPYFDESGKLLGYRGIDRDITEHKKKEDENRTLQEQLFQSSKLDSIGTLAGGIAHDFNNILGVIIGYSELALNNIKSEDPHKDTLEKINDSAKRSAHLVRQLLTFARKQDISPEVLNLNESVESMLKMIRRIIGENINLVWLPGIGTCLIKMDRTQVEQIILNLCVNSRDAISDVGKIIIETAVVIIDENYSKSHAGIFQGNYILLSVSDDGCGMDDKIKEHIFEPFFTTKEIGKGTGLGLSTVYGIVKQNKGFINVYTESGNGTVLNIYFPQFVDEEVNATQEYLEDILQGNGEIILVIEDDPVHLKMVGSMLDYLGYKSLLAGTPAEAIRLITENPDIHYLITDVIMPEMNGRDLVDTLNTLRSGLKYIFMSGYTANVIFEKGILSENSIIIHKPFSLRDISIKLTELLR